MSTLGNLLKNVAGAERRGDDFLAAYGMRRNPFPPARTIYPEVIYNQEAALTRFAAGIRDVVGEGIARRSLAVLGGSGQGKSHFQRHCQHEVQASDLPIVAVEFLAGAGSSQVLVREIYRAADEYVRRQGFPDLLSAVVARMGEGGGLGPVRQADLLAALSKLADASREGYVPQGPSRRYDLAALLDVCRRWIAGETLTQAERGHLRVSGRLASGSLMIRVMTELFSLARAQGLFRGVMLCLDEIEAVFVSGVATARIQAFLQDVRYLFDEAMGRDSGYSLLVLSGSTGKGASELSNYNYPLFQRLGFEAEARVQLHEVRDLDEARLFADVYIDYEHTRSAGTFEDFARPPSLGEARALITDEDLRHALLGPEPARGGDQRNQARLLEELHRAVEAKRTGGRGRAV